MPVSIKNASNCIKLKQVFCILKQVKRCIQKLMLNVAVVANDMLLKPPQISMILPANSLSAAVKHW